MVSIEERHRQKKQERADAAGILFLFVGAAAIVIGLFVGPSTLAGCIAGAWALYVLGLISMESDTASEMRGLLFLVTMVVCIIAGIGYFTIGTVKADEAMVSAGLGYLGATVAMVIISKFWKE